MISDANYNVAKEATMKNLSVYGTFTFLKQNKEISNFIDYINGRKETKIQLRLFLFRK